MASWEGGAPLFLFVCFGSGGCYFSFEEGDFIQGWRLGGREGEGVEVSYPFFVDDAFHFCNPCKEKLTYLCWIGLRFPRGLRVNMEKMN